MKQGSAANQLIGIFDSGVGGLSVLREIQALLPAQPLYYIGDQAHVPYGKRQPAEIRRFSFTMTRYLLEAGAGLIVVACNTASAAALKDLRQAFPDIPFVGMEPALKPATQQTHNKVVGVLATPATFQGELYNTLVEKFAQDVTVLPDTLPGLVEAIEAGQLDSPQTRAILKKAIQSAGKRRRHTGSGLHPFPLCTAAHPRDCRTGRQCHRPCPGHCQANTSPAAAA